MRTLANLTSITGLGTLLGALADHEPEHVAHWKQGEFHHDLVIRLGRTELPGDVLVVSTNCNGGVKEILCLAEVPDRWALWHARDPDNPEFEGELPPVLDQIRTSAWFDPRSLLGPDARSELHPEHRRRQRGGGWTLVGSPDDPGAA